MEFFVLAAIAAGLAYTTAAPDRVTLAATRGAAGAIRGVRRNGKATTRTVTASRPAKTDKRTGSTSAPQADGLDSLIGIWYAARDGWRGGVETARSKRTAGKDLWGRTVQATRFGGSVAGRVRGGVGNLTGHVGERRNAKKAEKAAKLDAAKANHQTQDPPALYAGPLKDWPGYNGPVDPDYYDHDEPTGPNPYVTPKENTMTANITELATIDEFRSEAENGGQIIIGLQEALAAYEQWASSLADRASNAGVKTTPILAAVSAIAESAPKVDPEAPQEACLALVAACDQAKSAAEPLTAIGAEGDARAYA